MRPKIMPCHDIARSLRYNEQKVEKGTAQCLMAANFLKDISRLTVEDKLRRFERRMDLNERVSTNLHITLNFDPQDNLSDDQMKKICRMYMDDIGFGRQPYLVYRHNDAGHPHCHIVTTHVQKNGNPIDLSYIGRNQSEQARKRIEAEFHLITAEQKANLRKEQHRRIDDVPSIVYGEQSTASALSAALEFVTEKYAYTSLEELNIILRLYNIEAYRGRENSQLYQRRGLLYRVLDEHGKYIGVPLKASFFDCKPTLDNLEKKFVLNQTVKEEHRLLIESSVMWEIYQSPDNLSEVKEKLSYDQIKMIMRCDKDGVCQDVAYLSFRYLVIFKGEDLNPKCSPSAIQQLIDKDKIRQQQELLQDHTQRQTQRIRMFPGGL